MSRLSPPSYTHYLPKEKPTTSMASTNTTTSSLATSHPPLSQRYLSHDVSETTPIEHYMDRLNRNYRQITKPQPSLSTSGRSITTRTEQTSNRHAYDLYNNDDFYIRKFGDFYLANPKREAGRGTYCGEMNSRHHFKSDARFNSASLLHRDRKVFSKSLFTPISYHIIALPLILDLKGVCYS